MSNWIEVVLARAWLRILRKALGLRTIVLPFHSLPAVGRMSVSSPFVMTSFKLLNAGKTYAQQIKPFNFLLSAHVRKLGYPIGVDPERFHLIAPFERDPKKWLAAPWIDEHTGQRYDVTTSNVRSGDIAELDTYGEVLAEYEYHEEFKCARPDGQPCDRQTVGILDRRHVRVGELHFIGKESNRLEEVEEGTIHDLERIYTEHPDAEREREVWLRNIVPRLKAMRLAGLQLLTGLSPATLKAARYGRMPHPKNRELLIKAIETESERHQGRSRK
ncbi:MAG TPA: hypothetical protein VMT95_15615 [Candidatus Binatia bacterium]|nr:hypothetical protein [Candidatus Binatia bacterium]